MVAVTQITAFKERVKAPGTQFFAQQAARAGLWLYPGRPPLLRELRPAVVHTRNLGAMEFQIPAMLARQASVHSEHGWDVDDLWREPAQPEAAACLYGFAAHEFVALSQAIEVT